MNVYILKLCTHSTPLTPPKEWELLFHEHQGGAQVKGILVQGQCAENTIFKGIWQCVRVHSILHCFAERSEGHHCAGPICWTAQFLREFHNTLSILMECYTTTPHREGRHCAGPVCWKANHQGQCAEKANQGSCTIHWVYTRERRHICGVQL